MKKSLLFVAVLLLCLALSSCGSSSTTNDGSEEVHLMDLTYSVPASWQNDLTNEEDPSAALCGNLHTDTRGGLDLAVDRYSWDYNGGYVSAADELSVDGEVPLPADYESEAVSIPGIKYKTDDGFWCYIYEIETDPAVYRLTFTLRGDVDGNTADMSAVLDSCTW